MTAIFEFSSFADRSNNCSSCFRANTFNFGNPLTSFRLSENSINFFIKKVDATTKIVKKIIELCDRSAHFGTKTIFCVFQNQQNSVTNSGDSRTDCYSTVKQQSSDLTDCRSSVMNNTLSCPVQSLNILLFRTFGWYELHCWLHQNNCDRLCIITVIFLPADKGFYILGTDHFYLMSQFFELTLPVKCARRGFHANQAGRNIRDGL